MAKHLFVNTASGPMHYGEFVKRTEKMTMYRTRGGIEHRTRTEPREVLVETDDPVALLALANAVHGSFDLRIEEARKEVLRLSECRREAVRKALEGE